MRQTDDPEKRKQLEEVRRSDHWRIIVCGVQVETMKDPVQRRVLSVQLP